MNTFLSNMTKNDVRGENGMPAHSTSDSAVLDLFFLLGTRPSGAQLITAVDRAWTEDKNLTLKCLFNSRDVRGGKGERSSFREAIKYLQDEFPVELIKLIPEYGRWDDVQEFINCDNIGQEAMDVLVDGLKSGNGLCAKWMPRKGPVAHAISRRMGLSPKQFRKLIVGLTKVVETQMCNNEWTGINYSHVPSRAGAIYAKAFNRHDPTGYSAWRTELAKPTKDSKVKINVGTLYPHEIVAKVGDKNYPVEEAWAKLQEMFPETTEKILPVCDVSGSMMGLPMDVCVALGIFLSQRNRGPFQDCFVTFSSHPTLQRLSGTLANRVHQLQRAHWDMNTNLEAVFDLVATAASKSKPEDVPSTILIMSDMQFDDCVNNASQNAFKMAKKKFESLGLKLPNIVFWNLKPQGANTLPVKADKTGTALVSGFSPVILNGIINAPSSFSPMSIMRSVLETERYAPIHV